MSQKEFATMSRGDVFSIKMVGSNDFVKERIATLVEDFEEEGSDWEDESNEL